MRVRACSVILLTLAVFVLATEATLAQPARGSACQSLEDNTDRPAMIDWLRAFYVGRAQRRFGMEQVLENGVVWRLETDAFSSLALPRIVQMPDSAASAKANRLLEALHGCLLVEYARDAAHWYRLAQETGESLGGVPPTLPRGRFISQPNSRLVRLTYATSQLASLVEVRVDASEGNAMRIEPRGHVLDLDGGRAYSATPCADEGLFRLGGLLDLCDRKSKSHFIALWSEELRAVTKTVAYRNDPLGPSCAQSLSITNDYQFRGSVHFTPVGLAIDAGHFEPNAAWQCLAVQTSVNPVVIPWRTLAPLLRAGPWRDAVMR